MGQVKSHAANAVKANKLLQFLEGHVCEPKPVACKGTKQDQVQNTT